MDNLRTTRTEIDRIDQELSKLLIKRLEKVERIKEIKINQGIPIEDKEREEEILKKLDTEFERNIFKKILEESRKIQA